MHEMIDPTMGARLAKLYVDERVRAAPRRTGLRAPSVARLAPRTPHWHVVAGGRGPPYARPAQPPTPDPDGGYVPSLCRPLAEPGGLRQRDQLATAKPRRLPTSTIGSSVTGPTLATARRKKVSRSRREQPTRLDTSRHEPADGSVWASPGWTRRQRFAILIRKRSPGSRRSLSPCRSAWGRLMAHH